MKNILSIFSVLLVLTNLSSVTLAEDNVEIVKRSEWSHVSPDKNGAIKEQYKKSESRSGKLFILNRAFAA